MNKPCKKFKYKEKRSSKPVINLKEVRQKKRDDKILACKTEQPVYGEYFGENDYLIDYIPVTQQTNSIEELRKWTLTQRFIPHDLSDEFLTLFLSAAGFDVKNASVKIKQYFFSRQEPSLLFKDRDPFIAENDNILEKLYVVPMPGITKMGQKIIITGLCRPLLLYSLLDHAKLLSLVLDLLIWENDFGYGDFVVILNGYGFTCPQLLQNEVYSHRSITSLLLDTIPGNLRAFYLVSPPPHVLNVAKNRNGISINVVNNLKKMSDHLGPDNLPQEYGGNLGHFSSIKEDWLIHVQDSRQLWINFEKKMANYYRRRLCHEEDLRVGGVNWVQKMKLEADQWEYKKKYYQRMACMEPPKHPAFGSERIINLKKHKYVEKKTSFQLFKQRVKEERDIYDTVKSSVDKLEGQNSDETRICCTSFCPILELEVRLD